MYLMPPLTYDAQLIASTTKLLAVVNRTLAQALLTPIGKQQAASMRITASVALSYVALACAVRFAVLPCWLR